jgi:thioesterase domain-containing protein
METHYLVPLAEEGDGTPIFIVPSAGSTFFSFVTLAETLQANSPIYSFSLTELEVTPSTHETLEDIADALLLELRAVKPKGPYHLAGHCWGGVVALDMAAKLEAQDEDVQSLFLLESFVPVVVGRGASDENSAEGEFSTTMQTILDDTLEETRAKLSRMPRKHADRLVELTGRQIETGNVYEPEPISVPICLFRTASHGDVAFRGWESLTTSTFAEREVPGDTHSMLEKPHVETLCTEIRGFIKPKG